MTYVDALAYLDTLTNYERTHRPGAMRTVPLERMRRLCERLGHPERRFRTIIVGGTNGKGSICAMVYAILRAAGLRAGLYTSPHVEEVRERIRVAAQAPPHEEWIRKEEFAALVGRIRPAIEELPRRGGVGRVTYFEAMTALAFCCFAERGVSVAVLEVGLGGRLDATNVVEAAVSVLSPIGLDHTDVLGRDVVAIAKEKAGIIKPRQRVITAAQEPEVMELLRHVAAAQRASFVACGETISARVLAQHPAAMELSVQGMRSRYEPVSLSLIGHHQAENAALAVAAVVALAEGGAPHDAIRKGLAEVWWPRRLEGIHRRPLIELYAAPNSPAASALSQAIEAWWPGRAVHVLLGMSKDKAIPAVGKILGGLARSITCTQSAHARACEASVLARRIGRGCPQVTAIPDMADAYTYVLNTASAEDVIVITGSLFLVGALRAVLRRRGRRARRQIAPVP